MELWNRVETPLGEMLVVSDGTALTEVCFAEERVFQGDPAEIPVLQQANEWINIFFDGEDPGPIPPVAPKGSPFQHEVWEIVAKVPYGELITYGDIAVEIAAKRGILKMAAQAVGTAVGKNPLMLFVPCHRVIGAGGNLTGYGGRMDRKIALLRLEGHDMRRFSFPDGTPLKV